MKTIRDTLYTMGLYETISFQLLRYGCPWPSSENGCSSCGAELRPNSKFCTKCGSRA